MKFEFKKPGMSTLLSIGGLMVMAAGSLINGEKEKIAKNETIDKAAEKAYKKVMEQMSSKQD